MKLDAWEHYQRPALGERAFDLSYGTLSTHPMWVDADKRKSFGPRQYSV